MKNPAGKRSKNRNVPRRRLRKEIAGILAAAAAVLAALLFPGCGKTQKGPNVLFIVWDTTRADRMSLYGYGEPTTPFLEKWAQGARVFTNCTSTASSTVPSHGAMFTGLFPTEHGANNRFKHLDDRFDCLAEIFRRAGYQTYLFSANPHISSEENFCQGIDKEEHPWDEKYRGRAVGILRRKLDPRDRSSELPYIIRTNRFDKWSIKATGKLAEEGLAAWLKKRDRGKPFFAFLNYMEAHQPFIPGIAFRRRFMTEEEVMRSFTVDYSWTRMWEYTFGLYDYTKEDLRLIGLAYDACIAELDALFEHLVDTLGKMGCLENTIIVLAGDHGEQLGEHHMLDHQYSLYEPLLRVPLILSFPGKVPPGRTDEPVVNFDIFPTLLDLAGLKAPPAQRSRAQSLLAPKKNRLRLAEYPSDFDWPIQTVLKVHRNFDPASFRRRLRALYDGNLKLIRSSDSRDELYDIAKDPGEKDDLLESAPGEAARMRNELKRFMQSLVPFDYEKAVAPGLNPEQRKRLEALGYGGGG